MGWLADAFKVGDAALRPRLSRTAGLGHRLSLVFFCSGRGVEKLQGESVPSPAVLPITPLEGSNPQVAA